MLALGLADPHGRQAERGLVRRDAVEGAVGGAGVHRQELAGHQRPAGDLDAADLDGVVVGAELDVVADRGSAGATSPSSVAIWRRTIATRPSRSPPSLGVDERDQAVADLELERVERQQGGDVLGLVGRVATAVASSWRACVLSSRDAASGSSVATVRTMPPMMKKGSFGRPGTRPSPTATMPASMSARGWLRICLARSWPRFDSPTERVTMMPVAVEISRAGIWETRPSPTVSSEKCCDGLARSHALLEHADGEAADEVDASR